MAVTLICHLNRVLLPVLDGGDGILRYIALAVEPLDVVVDGGLVVAQRHLGVAVRHRAESQTRLCPKWSAYLQNAGRRTYTTG